MQKKTLILFLSLFLVFLSCLTSYADFIKDQAHEASKVQKEIDNICDYKKIEYLNGLDKVIRQAQRAKTIRQATIPFELWLSQHAIQEDGHLDSNRLTNIVIALRSWSYVYEALLVSSSVFKNDKASLESSLAKNIFQYKGSIFDKYITWLIKWDNASKASYKILKEEEYSLKNLKKGQVSAWKNLAKDTSIWVWLSPDTWADGIRPSRAVKAIKPYEKIDVKYHTDDWYFMIREYDDMEDAYYRQRELKRKIIKYYLEKNDLQNSLLSDHNDNLAKLLNFNTQDDLYFKKLDTLVMFKIFDVPIQQFCWHSYLRCKGAQHWKDDKVKMNKALLDFASLKEFKYTVSPQTDDFLLKTRKAFKRNYSDEEYKEIEAQVKISKEWYDLLPKLKEPQPDNRLE